MTSVFNPEPIMPDEGSTTSVRNLFLKEEETVLQEAGRLVGSDRNIDYGHPLDDFAAQAQMWSAYLSKKYSLRIDLDYEDVAMLMVMVKVARQARAWKRDNLVDIAGYVRCLEMCNAEEDRRARESLAEPA